MENKRMKLTQDKIEKQEQWKKINSIIMEYKDGWKVRKQITQFNQPCMILLRRSQVAEYFEPTKQNKLYASKFAFTHSNGDAREIDLRESYLYKFPYGTNSFNCFIHHEDWANPLVVRDPWMEFKGMKDAVQHAFSADMKWKAEEKKASAKQIMAFAAIIAVLVGGFLLYILLKPSTPPVVNIMQGGLQNVTYTVMNIT